SPSPDSDGIRRAFWISCLGYLAPDDPEIADLVRRLTRGPHTKVREEAIKALGSLDRREDTVDFLLEVCTNDPAARQAAMLAFMRMRERARKAEPYVRNAVHDSDMLT